VAALQFLAVQIDRILLYFVYYQVNVTAATAQVSGFSSLLLSYITLSTLCVCIGTDCDYDLTLCLLCVH
jgi:hypothetical protein